MNQNNNGDKNTDMNLSHNQYVNQDLNHPRINLNESSVQELTSELGWTEATAQMFVEYRTRHGKFNTLEDLRNVPGIESYDIDEYRNVFEL